ncbi:MAG: hypothetical protein SGILL_006111, partial [Bacillariaceae sp.]
MAAQEYTRAYNAYSAALQLSPVGPSSHVFLSNRSAALLSLKRYSAAATDARRAIALAPTFGKAHARLGQSLYFLKDYESAVAAYEDAIHYEPDNPITKTYLEKARTKWQRQKDKAMKNAGRGHDGEVSVLTAESSVVNTVVNSVATDPNASAAVVTTGFRGQSKAMMDAVGRDMTRSAAVATTTPLPTQPEGAAVSGDENEHEEDDDFDYNQEDPDFDEALRIQERANRYLANKNYKYAIEEYTAALFLVPDDENLSPELHLGRAHALNGSRRHESAKIDATLAIRIKPTPEAYSTLAKSQFYMKDYDGAIESFGKCKDLLPEGESLSMFDRAYLQKAETALHDAMQEGKIPPQTSSKSTTAIPKLKPPKFVSREEALNRTPNMPSMPKQWPQQSPRDKKIIKFGPERDVVFLSEALGIKLNRGPDGIVRVIEVSPEVPGSPIAREGDIHVGDVIREAAGVDIRRPITNIMWGDTVALIKMAPRPITLIVAKEESGSIMDQRMQAAQNALSPTSAAEYFPSNASTEESVRDQMKKMDVQPTAATKGVAQIAPVIEPQPASETTADVEGETHVGDDVARAANVTTSEEQEVEREENVKEKTQPSEGASDPRAGKSLLDEDSGEEEIAIEDMPALLKQQEPEQSDQPDLGGAGGDHKVEVDTEPTSAAVDWATESEPTPAVDLRQEEESLIGGEVVFLRNADRHYNGWDNLRWMSLSGVRKVRTCEHTYRFVEGRKGFLWNTENYLPCILAVYEHPNLILILRRAATVAEFRQLMELPADAEVDEANDIKSHLFVESVVDPTTAKLRLSPLTTVTSILPDIPKDNARRRSCFELITPFESIILSAVRLRSGAERALTSFADSGAFLETSGLEYAVTKSLCKAHQPNEEENSLVDLSWKHQVILGTLHSYVVTGNQNHLQMGIQEALQSANGRDSQNPNYLNPRIVDVMDESGKTALHYACGSRFSPAVKLLVSAGADVNLRIERDNVLPCHMCAKNLDFNSLEVILAINRRANVVDADGLSPMYLATTKGRVVGSQRSPAALSQCIAVLEKYGGEIDAPMGHRHPVSLLATEWHAEELEVVLSHCKYRYPLRLVKGEQEGVSISALYQYPVHSALLSLRRRLTGMVMVKGDATVNTADYETNLTRTLSTLFACGFEPNERLEGIIGTFPGSEEVASYVGFAPIQIVAAALMDSVEKREALGEAFYKGATTLLLGVMRFLVQNGARLSLDAPLAKRTGENRQPSLNKSEDDDTHQSVRSALKIQSNKEMMKLIETSSDIVDVQKTWKTLKPAPASTRSVFFTDNKSPLPNSTAPGGSDEKSCAICWKAFGMLVRKHRCRLSRRFICDECSTQRVVGSNEEHRVSDGQYLLAKAEANRKIAAAQKQASQPAKVPGVAAARLSRLEEDENAGRDTLFGGI